MNQYYNNHLKKILTAILLISVILIILGYKNEENFSLLSGYQKVFKENFLENTDKDKKELILSEDILEIKENYNQVEYKNYDEDSICEKWIVLTTINSPTNHVKYLHDSTYDWCIVVVADKKTPISWNYKKIHFLSVDKQLKMASSFKVINKIRFNSYLRKMIGYLYAISKKAKYIYETDDDNSPTDGLYGFRYKSFDGLESNLNETFINPYAYFGQPSVWPRGYPLDKIDQSTKINEFSLYSSNKVSILLFYFSNYFKIWQMFKYSAKNSFCSANKNIVQLIIFFNIKLSKFKNEFLAENLFFLAEQNKFLDEQKKLVS
jgi:hypothetical protein